MRVSRSGRRRRSPRHQRSKCRSVGTSGGMRGVVEGEEHLVVDDDVAPAGALLELGDPGQGGDVALPEVVLRLPVALDEGRRG